MWTHAIRACVHAGVMCLDFHPTHAHLLAVGLHNGSVLVLSVHRAAPQPAASTGAEAGKHADMGEGWTALSCMGFCPFSPLFVCLLRVDVSAAGSDLRVLMPKQLC